MDLKGRIARLSAAVNQTIEKDLTKLPAKFASGKDGFSILQDFSGGKSDATLANELHSAIALIAGLEYFLQRWAAQNGKSAEHVRETFRQSTDLQIIHDLWNSEKHAESLQGGRDRSGRGPRLADIHRALKITPGSRPGSWVSIGMGPQGIPVASGDGSARAVLTGEVIDRYGSKIGDIDDIVARAIRQCEQLLVDFGLLQRAD